MMNATNPVNQYLRTDRIPHIWCSGCGLGTTVNCFVRAVEGCGHSSGSDQRGVGNRLHRQGGRIFEAGQLSYHSRPPHPICHRSQARKSETESRRVQRRRRSFRHRRQPLHPCRPQEYGFDDHLREQLYLRNDGRPGYADHSDRCHRFDHSIRQYRRALQSSAPGGICRRRLCRALDDVPRPADDKSHEGSHSEKRLQLCGNHQSVSDALRKKEPAGGWTRDDAVLQGKQHRFKNGADTREVGLDFKGKIICGKFIDRERPSFLDLYNTKMAERFGSSFKPYEGVL